MQNELETISQKTTSRKIPLRIIVAGGGTGGHIFPALSIANALKKSEPETKILFVGAKGKMEMDKVPEAGYEIKGLTIAGYNRSSLLKNIALPFKMVASFFEVHQIFKIFKPDAVIGVGGYSSFPVLKSAQLRGIASFIHESNSLPGKSNIMLGKKATRVFVAYDGMEKYFYKKNLIKTGNPVRKSLSQYVSKEEALSFFGLKAGKKTILITGGSLGARSINQAIEKNADAFRKNELQLIWQTGKEFANIAAAIEEESSDIWTNAFINNMEYAYSAADVVVCRSGAMTLSELCVVGKPAVLVPYPYAAEDHQVVNAQSLVKKGAAVMVKDAEVEACLMEEIVKISADEGKMKEMSNNMSALAIFNADEIIAAEILKNIKQ
ncbi:undecaprenyldiphospho-muramoylpentapeptide beta-N-acetylglucosaminyltransferase [soil metagenome]